MYFKQKHFIDALDNKNELLLKELEYKMMVFYNQKAVKEDYWKYTDDNIEVWDSNKLPLHCDLISKIKGGEIVIDFGCGSANFLAHLKKTVNYIGVEWSKEQLNLNKAKFPGYEFIEGDITNISVYPSMADWVVSLFAFEHIARPDLLIKNMLRSLKPGGKLAIICPNFINGMNSIRSGFRATPKRSKLKKLQLIDLLYSIIDEKIILPNILRFIHKSTMQFPIYLNPRCLDAPYFSDNDAIHLVNEKKIINYLQSLKLSIITSSCDIMPDSTTLYIVAIK